MDFILSDRVSVKGSSLVANSSALKGLMAPKGGREREREECGFGMRKKLVQIHCTDFLIYDWR
jgi:hypothetical protein